MRSSAVCFHHETFLLSHDEVSRGELHDSRDMRTSVGDSSHGGDEVLAW
jgi:hypothetical protein